MGIRGLAEYFSVKYATDEDASPESVIPESGPSAMGDDASFGVPINAQKTRILKDKLISVYDKLNKSVTEIPMFQKINTLFADNFYLQVFNDLIDQYVVFVENSSLKESFNYSVKLIQALNEFRNSLSAMKLEPKKMYSLDMAFRMIQDHIWKESKRLLNIHDLKGLFINAPDASKILNVLMPTWDFGPGKNPAKPLYKQIRHDTTSTLLNRVKNEELYEEIKERLGPYASHDEINVEMEKTLMNDKKDKRQQAVDKYNQGLSGKEKNKLRG